MTPNVTITDRRRALTAAFVATWFELGNRLHISPETDCAAVLAATCCEVCGNRGPHDDSSHHITSSRRSRGRYRIGESCIGHIVDATFRRPARCRANG